jgi:AbrB family looped-hinge helix DNA binding protein
LTDFLPTGIYNAMKTRLTIDQAGRVVLPKAVREQFHLGRGAALSLSVNSESIILKPESQKAPLRREGTLLVHDGTACGDLWSVLAENRARRDRQVSGLG